MGRSFLCRPSQAQERFNVGKKYGMNSQKGQSDKLFLKVNKLKTESKVRPK
jgi:hypothetical protein